MIETLANWGEFVGGFAVIFSLIYLGYQVRSSVRQARIDSYTSVTRMWQEFTASVASDEDSWRIYYQGVRDFDGLTDMERGRFNFLMGMYFGIVDTIMVHEEGGSFDYPDTYQRILDQAYAIFCQPGVQHWWQSAEGRIFAPKAEAYLLRRHGK